MQLTSNNASQDFVNQSTMKLGLVGMLAGLSGGLVQFFVEMEPLARSVSAVLGCIIGTITLWRLLRNKNVKHD